MPPPKPRPEPPPEPLYVQYGIDLSDPMPATWPVIWFWAQVGRDALKESIPDLAEEEMPICVHGWPGLSCSSAHPYLESPTPLSSEAEET